jgi:cyclophilin family peptidyl-prolyl cis-trans isomerase
MAKKKTSTKKPVNKKTIKKPVSAPKIESKIDNITTTKKPEILESTIQNPVTKEKMAYQAPGWWQNLETRRKVIGAINAAVLIGLFAGFTFYIIPERILTQTDDKVEERRAKEDQEKRDQDKKDADTRLNTESSVLKFDQNKNWDLSMKIAEFGDLKINLKNEFAPKTVENFVRLSYRGYYDNTIIHRIVKDTDFAVIQGGDKESRNGSGGRSAFFVENQDEGLIPDEIWTTKPEFKVETKTTETGAETQQNVLANEPKLRYPDLYANFNPDGGTVEYRKGLILMAKTTQPDSASSQFFITLDKTILPAEYTVFGVISPESFAVLDKIKSEVNPVQNDEEGNPVPDARDGTPSKEIKIEKVEITSPKVV